MKKRTFSLMTVIALSVIFFTSCLGNGGSKTEGYDFAIYESFNLDTGKPVFKRGNYASGFQYLYGPEMEGAMALKLEDSRCYLLQFSIDSEEQVSQKYTTMSLRREPELYPEGVLIPYLNEKDTTTLLENEMVVNNADFGQLVDKLLLLGCNFKHREDDNITYTVQFDNGQEPVEEYGKHIYDFYLRVVKNSNGSKSETDSDAVRFFPIGHTILNINDKFVSDGKGVKSFYFRLNYLKSTEEKESVTRLTWGQSKLFELPVINRESL